jgi:hypothetical protein
VRRLLLLVLWLAALPACAAEPALIVATEPGVDAWWQRAQWHPRATVVRGVPIKRLHPEWCAAEAFSRETIGDALLAVTPMTGLDFALEGSFDGAGRPQIAFVGAYRRCAGEQGLFVTIVEPAKDRPRMRFLVELPNPGSAFAAIGRDPDGALVVWWCAACDNGVRIEFNRETRGFFVAGPASRRR